MSIRIFGRKRNKGREPKDVEGTVRRADGVTVVPDPMRGFIVLPDPMRGGDDPLPPDVGNLGPISEDEENASS